MTNHIEAILFDMGGTLRGSVPVGPEVKLENVRQIVQLLEAPGSPEDMAALLTRRFQNYMRWARETLVELDERKLWTQWMLPDWPVDRITELALELHKFWRQATGIREIFPESKDVILELFRRGYRLGIVSNTTSTVEVPHTLRALQITGCLRP